MPFKYSLRQKQTLLNALCEYINTTPLPLMSAFCAQYNVDDETLKSWANDPEVEIDWGGDKFGFSRALKKMRAKQQTELITRAIESRNPGGPIFLLKALHRFQETHNEPAQQTHIHVHTNKEVKQLPEDGLSDLIQGDLLKKPAGKGKRN